MDILKPEDLSVSYVCTQRATHTKSEKSETVITHKPTGVQAWSENSRGYYSGLTKARKLLSEKLNKGVKAGVIYCSQEIAVPANIDYLYCDSEGNITGILKPEYVYNIDGPDYFKTVVLILASRNSEDRTPTKDSLCKVDDLEYVDIQPN